MDVDALDLDRLEKTPGILPLAPATIHVNEMDPKEADLIRKTGMQTQNISSIPSTSSLDPSRISLGSPVQNLEQCVEDLDTYKKAVAKETKSFEFPNLAWESVKAGLMKERSLEGKIEKHIKAIEESHHTIDLLLQLQAKLGSEKDKEPINTDAKELLKQLKERGVSLGEENVEEIKRLASSHESKLRSDVQIQFTTKVNYLMQQVESLNQILQNIIRSDERIKQKANQLPR